ncbi:MAG: sodium:alanine symporter family protein [Oscillospiraceae bacterium]|jgi:AGCS family alanine or glycine:cation symporter|nr:sodium:alanine symporter family protein [Oscillospiraceae bacterium]
MKLDKLEVLIAYANETLWGIPLLALFLGVGLMYSYRLRLYQVRGIREWLRQTVGGLKRAKRGKTGITPFSAMCTALSGTMGIGNIAGVATALTLGGAGAILWMWVSAILGMATGYAEKFLAVKYRQTDPITKKHYGGAVYYIRDGLKNKPLAAIFALCFALASFGIGNMTQANSAAQGFSETFDIPAAITAIALMSITAIVSIGGVTRINSVTSKLVPLMSLFYIAGSLIVIAANARAVPGALYGIISGAFSLKPAGGGIAGYSVVLALRVGIAKGVFTNEAGLGSGVTAHAAAENTTPHRQGQWGMFEVFADTLVVCTLTALVILVSGVWTPGKAPDGIALTALAFNSVLPFGEEFVSISCFVFALSTIISWSYYGESAITYLGGRKKAKTYKILYIAAIFIGSTSKLTVVWNISEFFNGLMAIPNLLALIALSREVPRSGAS